MVNTEKGSVFIVEDKYTLLKDGVFGIYRDVKVKEALTLAVAQKPYFFLMT